MMLISFSVIHWKSYISWIHFIHFMPSVQKSDTFTGADREVAVNDGNHGWPTKKILGFRWSKKAKITLETISFWQNISISIFKFSPFLYTMKACQWNLINFSKFANALIRKEKKHLCSSQWEKKNWEKLDFVL